jgi:hypothetical protein
MYGLGKNQNPALPGGNVPDRLPSLAADGTVAAPPGFAVTSEGKEPATAHHRRRR